MSGLWLKTLMLLERFLEAVASYAVTVRYFICSWWRSRGRRHSTTIPLLNLQAVFWLLHTTQWKWVSNICDCNGLFILISALVFIIWLNKSLFITTISPSFRVLQKHSVGLQLFLPMARKWGRSPFPKWYLHELLPSIPRVKLSLLCPWPV